MVDKLGSGNRVPPVRKVDEVKVDPRRVPLDQLSPREQGERLREGDAFTQALEGLRKKTGAQRPAETKPDGDSFDIGKK